MRTLYHMTPAENKNIPKYINKMKGIVNQINSMKSPFKISDEQFAEVLMQSLPVDWEPFIDKLFSSDHITDHVPKLNIVHFQCQIKNKYLRKIGQSSDEALLTTQTSHQANLSFAKPGNFGKKNRSGVLKAFFCKNCKWKNHATDQCSFLGKERCTNCDHFGHRTLKCYQDSKTKHIMQNQVSNDTDVHPNKKVKYKAHAAEEEQQGEMSAQFIEENINVDYPVTNEENYVGTSKSEVQNNPSYNEEEDFGLIDPSDMKDENVFYTDNGNATHVIYIVCLSNSETTLYVFNQRDLFSNYHPIHNTYVGSISGTETRMHGRGTIKLLMEQNICKRTINLCDVLHVPDCRYNLISLGR